MHNLTEMARRTARYAYSGSRRVAFSINLLRTTTERVSVAALPSRSASPSGRAPR